MKRFARSARLLTLAWVIGLISLPARAIIIDVAIDTSPLNGQAVVLDFLFGDNDSGANTATIFGFSTDGALGGVNALTTPGTSGTLPGNVTLPANPAPPFFEEYAHDITLGNSIDFAISISTVNADGFIPDDLSFFLLDPGTLIPVSRTDDPTLADALFSILLQATGSQRVGLLAWGPFGPDDADIDVQLSIRPPPPPGAPEPGTIALLLAALAAVALVERRRPLTRRQRIPLPRRRH